VVMRIGRPEDEAQDPEPEERKIMWERRTKLTSLFEERRSGDVGKGIKHSQGGKRDKTFASKHKGKRRGKELERIIRGGRRVIRETGRSIEGKKGQGGKKISRETGKSCLHLGEGNRKVA